MASNDEVLSLLDQERTGSAWRPSRRARDYIIGGYSAATWRMLAEEARERLALIGDLPHALRVAQDQPLATTGYVERMAADRDRAGRFTRMLLEIHQGLADEVASSLDLSGVRRLMDLGGGSGVVAMALVRRWPDLRVVIVDIANVCVAGREIVAEANLSDRIDVHAADFTRDPLPGGFDAVLECDVAVFTQPRSVVSAMFSSRAAGSSWSTSSSRRTATPIGPDWVGGLSVLRPPVLDSRDRRADTPAARSGRIR